MHVNQQEDSEPSVEVLEDLDPFCQLAEEVSLPQMQQKCPLLELMEQHASETE